MKTGTRALLVIVAILVAIGVITFVNRMKSSDGELVQAVERTRSPVRVVVAVAANVDETISHTDALEATRDVLLTAEVAGKVVRLHKDLGDGCKKGEALLQLDAEVYKIALLQAEAGLKQAKAQLAQARRDSSRVDTLVKRSTVAAQSAEKARTAVETSGAAVKQAGAAVMLARRNLRLARVTCPFAGNVAERHVTQGQMVGNTTPLARLVDASQLKVTLKVPAADLARMKVGQRAVLEDPAQTGSRFLGQVSRLGVAADQLTHTFPVEVTVQGTQDGQPHPGQVLKATIVVASHAGALAIPEDALVYLGRDKAPHLALARGDKAHLSAVTLGPKVGSRRIIRAGLAAGDKVVILGQHGLSSGAPIEVMDDKPSPAKAPSAAATPARTKKAR